MALQKQAVNVNFSEGVDTKTDPWQIPIGKFLSMENSVFTVGKQLTTRDGFPKKAQTITNSQSLGYQAFGANVSSGKHLGIYNDELVLLDGMNLFSYAPASLSWAYRGRAETTSIALEPIFQNQNNHVSADMAVNTSTGLKAFAWEALDGDPVNNTGGFNLYGVQYSVLDAYNNQVYVNGETISGNIRSRPRCVSVGSLLYIFYVDFDTSTAVIKAVLVDETGAGSPVTVVSDLNSTSPDSITTPEANYDIFVVGSTIYIGYNGDSSNVKIASFDSSLTLVSSVSKSESASNGIGIFTDSSSNIWAAYNNGSETKAFIMDSSLTTTVLAPTVVDAGSGASNCRNVTGIYDGTKAIIFYDQPGVPEVSQSLGVSTTASFTQPAVGSTVSVSVADSSLLEPYSGQTIYIEGGGYYRMGLPVSGTAFLVTNLGYTGNAAPSASVGSPAEISSVGTFSNAVITYNTLTVGGTAGTAATLIRSCALNSRAFLYNGFAHVIAGHTSFLQPSYFLCGLYNTPSSGVNAHISAKVAPMEGGGIPYLGSIPQVIDNGDSSFSIALLKQSALVTYTRNGTTFSYRPCGIIETTIDFSPQEISSQSEGKNLLIGLGGLLMYDGGSVVEHGFSLYPENIVVAMQGSGGFLSAGEYGYAVTYEWIDNQGQTHKSAPSPVVSVTAVDSDSAILTIPTLRVTEKTNVTICIYRTTANGTVYYRINQTGTVSPSYNSTSTDSITFTDTLSDESIIGNNQLYTGGEVENIAAPAATGIAAFKNRVFYILQENPTQYGFSKQIVPGSPVEFTDLFIKNSGSVGGTLRGIALLDDKLILFKKGSIYFVVGTGPAASGANDDFSDPFFVTADCGNVDLLSIVVMPLGLMFKSDKGIYILNRNLQTEYIGAPVEEFNQYSVLSAKLLEKSNEVRFHLSNGTVLVYDYFYGQWDSFPSLPAVSDVIYQGYHTFLNSSGEVYQQTPNTFLDGTSPVNMSFETGWINLAGLQGYERAYHFYLLAKYYSSHTLQIQICYDYDETVVQTSTITPDSSEAVEQWQVYFERQKIEAFKLIISVSSDGTGRALSISGLNMTIGIKDTKPRLAAARSVG